MDEETLSQSGGIEKKDETFDTSAQSELKEDLEGPVEASALDEEAPTVEESFVEESQEAHLEDVLPSIETDQHDLRPSSSASRRSSKRTEEIIQAAARDIIAHIEQHNKAKQEGGADPSEFDHLDTKSNTSRGAARAADDSSSQHEATDEDVFSDKSPRSSLGSYDFGSECGKGHEFPDNLTSVSRSPRISDLSHYDKDEDFIPTIRGTPRPAFRTPSDVRALQMSSPTQSVVGTSPRSSRRYAPTVSRLGTPTASAQYSPKKTPDRLKPRKEAPLVLLHVTLLPLRWAWGDLIGSLEPADMSRDAKGLRDAWRLLQDRLGDTTCERGILLGHPQNDYEVLEERLLDALELPVRRRARILECGHYLGPANEMAEDDDGESDREEYDDDVRSRRSSRRGADKRHWCGTCQGDIHYETLGARTKVFRVKVYASNGLMKAGAWAACWKEMERVDVEIEPIVEPAVQDELVRLAATQQEREREEDEIAHEVAQQFEAEKKKEEEEEEEERGRSRGSRHSRSEMHARVDDAEDDDDVEGDTIPPAEEDPEPSSFTASSSEEEEERRRRLDEERMREIYGDSSASPTAEQHHKEHPSAAGPDPHPHPSDASAQQPHSNSYAPPPDSYSVPEDMYHGQENKHQKLDSASLPELLLESARVLLQDRKNLAIIALSVFVVLLAVRVARREPPYEPGFHGIVASVPELRHVPVVEAPYASIQDDAPVADVPRAIVDESETEVPELPQVLETQEPSELEQAPELQESSESLSSSETQDMTGEVLPPIESVEACTNEAQVEQPSVEESTESTADVDEVSAAAACSTAGETESVVSEQAQEDATTTETEGKLNDYDACVHLHSAQGKDAPALSEAAGSEDAEFEIVTQKRTVKIIQTVTETETQVEYVKVTATAFLQLPEPTSSVNDGPDAVLCDPVSWMVGNENVEGKEEPTVEIAAETEIEENSEAGEVRACPEEVEEAP